MATVKQRRRLAGIGSFVEYERETPTSRPRRAIDVTRAFATEWDHDILNRAPLMREAMAAVKAKQSDALGYSVDLRFRGRVFTTLYPASGDDE